MPSALLTKLKDLVITEVSGVDAPANLLDGWLVQKRREIAPDALRKAQSFSVADALAVVVDRAAGRALLKTRIAMITKSEALPLTEVERLSVEFLTKARHAVRHPDGSGRFAPTPSKVETAPGPDPNTLGGAETNFLATGTGPDNEAPSPTSGLWVHGGASLFRSP
jgi:hypothetical protein